MTAPVQLLLNVASDRHGGGIINRIDIEAEWAWVRALDGLDSRRGPPRNTYLAQRLQDTARIMEAPAAALEEDGYYRPTVAGRRMRARKLNRL